MHKFADLQAAGVDPGEKKNQQYRDELLRRKTDRIRAHEMDWPNEIVLRPNGRKKDPREFGKSDGDGRDGAGLDDEKKRPAEKKPDRRSISLAQEYVLSARARHHRRQFRAAKRARDGEEASHRPGEQQPAGRTDQACRFGRSNENPRADHRADHDHGGVERTEAADQLVVRCVHSSGSRGGDGDPRAQKLGPQFPCKSDRFRIVSVNADCLGLYCDIAAVDRAHPILMQHPQNAFGRGLGIVQQCIRARAVDQRSVGQVISIGKNFIGHTQPDSPRRLGRAHCR